MPYIQLCCPSKRGTSRRVGSSWTHLISRMENEMFRRVLANCCIFSNRMRSCEKLSEEERACSLPVFYRQNKRRHIKRTSYSITDKKRRVLGLRKPFFFFFTLMLAAMFSKSPLVSFGRFFNTLTCASGRSVEASTSCSVCKQAGIRVASSHLFLSQRGGSSQSSEWAHLLWSLNRYRAFFNQQNGALGHIRCARWTCWVAQSMMIEGSLSKILYWPCYNYHVFKNMLLYVFLKLLAHPKKL